LDFDLQD